MSPGGRPTPRIGVPISPAAPSPLPEAVLEAGGDPVPLRLPSSRPAGGVALAREWVADAVHVSCAGETLDGLLLAADRPEELAGLVLAALRLGLPAVVSPPPGPVWAVAFAALGLSPLGDEPARVIPRIAIDGGPRPGDLVEGFSLANALRAGLSAGGGPELLVHLCAMAREAGVVGFGQMMRVLVPETPLPAPGSDLVREHGVAGVLARLGDTLNDTETVSGKLRGALPPSPSAPPEPSGRRMAFVAGRASGTEAVCRTAGGGTEVAGECAVFAGEDSAARAVEGGRVGPGSLLVIGGCGPRGGPGLLRLGRLARALEEGGLAEGVPVVTDGLPPEGAGGTWVSLFSPEAARGGVISRLRDGDSLRFDLADGRIRTGVRPEEFREREPDAPPAPAGAGYAARYARSALPALSGAGFG